MGRGARPPDLRPDAAGRHPRDRALQDLRSAQGGDGEPADLLGGPALLDAHGRPARGHPPHDDPQELRLHALYHWARHGGLQVQHRRGGFYGAYDAQDFALENGPKMGMQAVPSLNLVYTDEEGYVTAEEAKEQELSALKLSGTKFRKMLRGGEDIPEWFAFKSVVEVLRQNA